MTGAAAAAYAADGRASLIGFPVTEAEAVEGRGLTNNANQGGKRQVTLIDEAHWREAQDELGIDDDPGTHHTTYDPTSDRRVFELTGVTERLPFMV